jgi:hypothetical protein
MTLVSRRTAFWIALLCATGCSVSDEGLGPALDADSGEGMAVCPANLTDSAPWPAGTSYTACTQPCGPDDLGVRTCSQIDTWTCQASTGCVCLSSPCVRCSSCTFAALPDCYVPANVASIPTCEPTLRSGDPCASACDRSLCIQRNGKTACVCGAHGKYACAAWTETGWK